MTDRPILHLALIMDGNGRWAQRRGLSRSEGHRAGVDNIIPVVTSCFQDFDIPTVSLFTFSTENWNRPKDEVDTLFDLLRAFFRKNIDRFVRDDVRIRVSGILDDPRIPESVLASIDFSIEKTKDCSSHTLNILFNYGSRAELQRAVKEAATDLNRKPDADIETLLESHLLTSGLPDVDLLIRTSGEMRLSNCLLYQCAYAELVFTPVLWPDFSREDLSDCIKEYRMRDRRYGKIVR